MFFRQIFVIALATPFLLSACGPENGPKPEQYGFTKTFTVPAGKDKWLVEMLIKSFSAVDKKSTVALYEKIEPTVIDAINAEAQGWDMKPSASNDTNRSIDSMRTSNGKALCERIKQALQKQPGVPIVSDCLMISYTKI